MFNLTVHFHALFSFGFQNLESLIYRNSHFIFQVKNAIRRYLRESMQFVTTTLCDVLFSFFIW